jgi:energy-coupling factor transport system ATP-binding protein
MLQMQQAGVSFRGETPVLSAIDLTVHDGEVVVVTGAAGCGKSTLLALAAGIIPTLIRPRLLRGTVLLQGESVARIPSSQLYRRIGAVLQSVDDQVLDLSVEDLLAFPLENRGMAPADIRRRVLERAEMFGVRSLFGRAVRSLSGGERRIVVLTSSMMWQPSLLVLDEMTNGLDPDARARVVAILRRLRAGGQSMLIAEQNLGAMDGLADRAVFLGGNGRIVADLPWAAIANDDAVYERAGIESPFQPPRRAPVTRRVTAAAPRLAVRNLSTRLRRSDGRPVLPGLDLALHGGEVTALIGPNGAGKSTLLQTMLGLIPRASGTISVDGESADDWSVAQRARRIGYVTQNTRRMFFLLSALEEVVFSLAGGEAGAAVVARHRDAAMRLLAGVGLGEHAALSPFALSTREQLMLALACMEAAAPSLLILDEPLVAWDRKYRHALLATLERFCGHGRAVLLVTHDLQLAQAAAQRLLILRDGTLAFDGPLEAGWQSEAFRDLGWPALSQAEMVHAAA